VVEPPTSTKMVPFVLLPLEIGQVDVEVKAVGLGVMDHVKKVLLVQVLPRSGVPLGPGCDHGRTSWAQIYIYIHIYIYTCIYIYIYIYIFFFFLLKHKVSQDY
jgi:hypothetical protein